MNPHADHLISFIPVFHVGTLSKTSMQQMAMEANGKCPIKMRCGLIELDVPLGTSLHVMNAEISLKARVAMFKFRQTFPDEHHFRTKLIDLALTYESYHVESVRPRGIHVISFYC